MRPLILLIDDSMVTRKILSNSLFKNGYNIVEAANGEDALILLKSMIPDAILFDLKMPKIHGQKFISIIRNKGQLADVPSVVISSLTKEEVKAVLEGITYQGHFTKPVDIQGLLELLPKIIRQAET